MTPPLQCGGLIIGPFCLISHRKDPRQSWLLSEVVDAPRIHDALLPGWLFQQACINCLAIMQASSLIELACNLGFAKLSSLNREAQDWSTTQVGLGDRIPAAL